VSSAQHPIAGVVSPRRRFGVIGELPRFWRNPIATIRRWRWGHRYPRPSDFDKMSAGEFDAYLHDIGFDARIAAAVAESDEVVRQAGADADVRQGEGSAAL
jgi:hypothetical protein